MKIKTKDFGIMEVSESEIIRFPKGLYAYEDAKSFVLIKSKVCPVMYLQCAQSENPRFPVFEASDIVDGYEPSIPEEDLKAVRASSRDELSLLLIAVVPDNIRDMTVNLKSPVIVNMKKRLAAQIILEENSYPIRYRMFD